MNRKSIQLLRGTQELKEKSTGDLLPGQPLFISDRNLLCIGLLDGSEIKSVEPITCEKLVAYCDDDFYPTEASISTDDHSSFIINSNGLYVHDSDLDIDVARFSFHNSAIESDKIQLGTEMGIIDWTGSLETYSEYGSALEQNMLVIRDTDTQNPIVTVKRSTETEEFGLGDNATVLLDNEKLEFNYKDSNSNEISTRATNSKEDLFEFSNGDGSSNQLELIDNKQLRNKLILKSNINNRDSLAFDYQENKDKYKKVVNEDDSIIYERAVTVKYPSDSGNLAVWADPIYDEDGLLVKNSTLSNIYGDIEANKLTAADVEISSLSAFDPTLTINGTVVQTGINGNTYNIIDDADIPVVTISRSTSLTSNIRQAYLDNEVLTMVKVTPNSQLEHASRIFPDYHQFYIWSGDQKTPDGKNLYLRYSLIPELTYLNNNFSENPGDENESGGIDSFDSMLKDFKANASDWKFEESKNRYTKDVILHYPNKNGVLATIDDVKTVDNKIAIFKSPNTNLSAIGGADVNSSNACKTQGAYSFAFGVQANTAKLYSMAFGNRALTTSINEIAFGPYNTSTESDELAFSIGCGSSTANRLNLLQLNKLGDFKLYSNKDGLTKAHKEIISLDNQFDSNKNLTASTLDINATINMNNELNLLGNLVIDDKTISKDALKCLRHNSSSGLSLEQGCGLFLDAGNLKLFNSSLVFLSEDLVDNILSTTYINPGFRSSEDIYLTLPNHTGTLATRDEMEQVHYFIEEDMTNKVNSVINKLFKYENGTLTIDLSAQIEDV